MRKLNEMQLRSLIKRVIKETVKKDAPFRAIPKQHLDDENDIAYYEEESARLAAEDLEQEYQDELVRDEDSRSEYDREFQQFVKELSPADKKRYRTGQLSVADIEDMILNDNTWK